MFDERARTLRGILLFLDAACIAAAFGLASILRLVHPSLPLLGEIPSLPWGAEGAVRAEYLVLLVTNVAAWLIYLRRNGLYAGEDWYRPVKVLSAFTRAQIVTILCTGLVVFALKMSVSRLLFAYFFVAQFALLLIKQFVMGRLMLRLTRSLRHQRHALVIGAPGPGAWFAQVLAGAENSGYKLVGLMLATPARFDVTPNVPQVGSLKDLDRVLADHPVEEVFIVGSAREMAELAPTAQSLIERGRIVSLVSTMSSGHDGVRGRVTSFNGVPMLSYGPMPRDEVSSGIKRVLDVAVSSLALLLLSPLLLAIAGAIRASDGGPALFRQTRLGQGGNPFPLYKFRSMRADAEQILRADGELYRRYVANDFKLAEAEDPRVSRLGRFLRRSSLDELPQFWNVLRGDMTLVGPRPIVPAELEKYEPYADLFLSVRPGLTGRWQVLGRSGIRYPERAFLDFDYIGGARLRDDLSILLRTVPAVVRRRGAL